MLGEQEVLAGLRQRTGPEVDGDYCRVEPDGSAYQAHDDKPR
ncbi:hypothetical protein [Nocardia sp. NRRL S-836]|nr:hypothetical protein [Nocardia sp. NRRL S-836]